MNADLPDFIPATFDEITPDFLTRSLRDAGMLANGRVEDLRFERIGEGVGFAGEVARLHLSYADPNETGPATLVAKLPTSHGRNRAAIEMANAYEREVCFFQQLAARSRIPLPDCYLAVMDPDPRYDRRPDLERFIERIPVILMRVLIPLTRLFFRVGKRRYLVLLEDLAPAHNGDQVAGCERAEAIRAVRQLARFHASFWADDQLAELIWLPRANTLPRAIMAIHRGSRRRFFRRYGDVVPEGMREICTWTDAHFESVMDHLASPPCTLLHGDYRFDNLLYDDEAMFVTDFQTVLRGRPAIDLAYFVTGSVVEDVDEDVLIDAYCDELVTRGITGYDGDTCRRDYVLSKMLFLYGHVAAEDLIDLGDERGAELLAVMRKRLFARVPDPPYDDLLPER